MRLCAARSLAVACYLVALGGAGLPGIWKTREPGAASTFFSDLIAGNTFGNRPIAVKMSAVSDPCGDVVKVGLGSV